MVSYYYLYVVFMTMFICISFSGDVALFVVPQTRIAPFIHDNNWLLQCDQLLSVSTFTVLCFDYFHKCMIIFSGHL